MLYLSNVPLKSLLPCIFYFLVVTWISYAANSPDLSNCNSEHKFLIKLFWISICLVCASILSNFCRWYSVIVASAFWLKTIIAGLRFLLGAIFLPAVNLRFVSDGLVDFVADGPADERVDAFVADNKATTGIGGNRTRGADVAVDCSDWKIMKKYVPYKWVLQFLSKSTTCVLRLMLVNDLSFTCRPSMFRHYWQASDKDDFWYQCGIKLLQTYTLDIRFIKYLAKMAVKKNHVTRLFWWKNVHL